LFSQQGETIRQLFIESRRRPVGALYVPVPPADGRLEASDRLGTALVFLSGRQRFPTDHALHKASTSWLAHTWWHFVQRGGSFSKSRIDTPGASR
jgi:hypothetical protein